MPPQTATLTRLLIVDDELAICDFLRAFFVHRNYDVRTACSGEEALQTAESFRPRIVLLDVRMPGLSGIDVLEQLRQRQPDVNVIMITAVVDEGLMERARQLGALDYINKPFSLDYLERDVLQKIGHL